MADRAGPDPRRRLPTGWSASSGAIRAGPAGS